MNNRRHFLQQASRWGLGALGSTLGLYTVNGHVSRSSGKSTTWINGTTQNEAYHPRNPALIPLRPVEEEPAIDLKVGQTLDRNSGAINNGLGGGEIRIRPGSSTPKR